jgi:hypothetical protein
MPTVYHPYGFSGIIITSIPHPKHSLFQNLISALTTAQHDPQQGSCAAYRRVGVMQLSLLIPKNEFEINIEDKIGQQGSVTVEIDSGGPDTLQDPPLESAEVTRRLIIALLYWGVRGSLTPDREFKPFTPDWDQEAVNILLQ